MLADVDPVKTPAGGIETTVSGADTPLALSSDSTPEDDVTTADDTAAAASDDDDGGCEPRPWMAALDAAVMPAAPGGPSDVRALDKPALGPLPAAAASRFTCCTTVRKPCPDAK